MRLNGTITEFDYSARKGVVTDPSGQEDRISPGSVRKTVRLSVGAEVSFQSFNLSDGPNARDIELA